MKNKDLWSCSQEIQLTHTAPWQPWPLKLLRNRPRSGTSPSHNDGYFAHLEVPLHRLRSYVTTFHRMSMANTWCGCMCKTAGTRFESSSHAPHTRSASHASSHRASRQTASRCPCEAPRSAPAAHPTKTGRSGRGLQHTQLSTAITGAKVRKLLGFTLTSIKALARCEQAPLALCLQRHPMCLLLSVFTRLFFASRNRSGKCWSA